jgi:cysteinyl-tRNA synthetase
LHAGGVDLVFPHHSNEIAQSEAYSGERFCNYWVHNGFVNIDNEKMSKSLKNFKTLRDLAASPFDARALRFMVVTSQYRAPLNFTPDTLKAAASSLQRIDKLVARLESAAAAAAAAAAASLNGADVKAESEAESGAVMATTTGGKSYINLEEAAKTASEAFDAAMCDDLNTPRASAALFGLVGAAEKALNAGLAGAGAAADSASITAAISAIRRFDRVFGVLYDVPTGYFSATSSSSSTSTSSASRNGGGGGGGGGDVPAQVMELAKQRAELKAAKKYAEADATRAQIAELGYTVKDKAGGQFDVFRTTV